MKKNVGKDDVITLMEEMSRNETAKKKQKMLLDYKHVLIKQLNILLLATESFEHVSHDEIVGMADDIFPESKEITPRDIVELALKMHIPYCCGMMPISSDLLIPFLSQKCLFALWLRSDQTLRDLIQDRLFALMVQSQVDVLKCVEGVTFWRNILKTIRMEQEESDETTRRVANNLMLIHSSFLQKLENTRLEYFPLLFALGDLIYNFDKFISDFSEHFSKTERVTYLLDIVHFSKMVIVNRDAETKYDVVTKKAFSILRRVVSELVHELDTFFCVVVYFSNYVCATGEESFFHSMEVRGACLREFVLLLLEVVSLSLKVNGKVKTMNFLSPMMKDKTWIFSRDIFPFIEKNIGVHDVKLILTFRFLFEIYYTWSQDTIDYDMDSIVQVELNPMNSFYHFLKCLRFSKDILIEYLTSKETFEFMLMYILAVAKWIHAKYGGNYQIQQTEQIIVTLENLYKEIVNLTQKKIFPYSPSSLLKRLNDAIQTLQHKTH